MKIDAIRKVLNRAPFRPFEIHLTTGEILLVGHPERMGLPDDEEELFVLWTADGWNLIDASQVARVSVKPRSRK